MGQVFYFFNNFYTFWEISSLDITTLVEETFPFIAGRDLHDFLQLALFNIIGLFRRFLEFYYLVLD